MLETWTVIAGAIPAAGIIMIRIREELFDLKIRNSRQRARAVLGIGRLRMERTPGARNTGAAETRPNGEAMFYHNANEPQPCCREIVRITVPDDKPKKTYDLTSRKGRALLAADIKDGLVDMSTWSVARIAQALGASPRSTYRALSLSAEQRDDVRAGRRPLFVHRTSVPEPSPAPARKETMIECLLRHLIDEMGEEEAFATFVKVKYETAEAA
jgi:hypothetical protein